MNLLSNSDSKVIFRTKILDALRDIGVTSEEMRIAESFLDFSMELDVSLLENLKCRYFPNANYDKAYKTFTLIMNQKNKLYFERYVLLLDALMGNMIFKAMFPRSYFFCYNYKNEDFRSWFIHTYEQRYTNEEDIQAKLSAIFVEIEKSDIKESYIGKIAVSNPEALYKAFKYYCVSPDCVDRLKLSALALAYSALDQRERYLKLPKAERTANLSPEHAREMANFVVSNFDRNVGNLSDKNVFDIVMPSMFMAISFDERIEEKLREQNIGSSKNADIGEKFLIAMFFNLPNSYFDSNIERILDIIEINSSEDFTMRCVKDAVRESFIGDSSINARTLLKYFAEKYPEYVVAVMRSVSVFNTYGNHLIYNGNYNEIFKIIKEVNPKALTDLYVNFNEDIMNILIQLENIGNSIAQNEVEKYLRGQADLSILEPYFYDFANQKVSYDVDSKRMIELCIDNIPGFEQRYYSLKAIQSPQIVVYYVKKQYYAQEAYGRETAFKTLIRCLNDEKVPVKYRFDVYSKLYASFYDEDTKESVNSLVLEGMILRKAEMDEEYRAYCPNGEVFDRKLYVQYLAATNDDNINSSSILSMFEDPSKDVRRTIVKTLSDCKKMESGVLELLKSKKMAVRETAVDVLSTWGAKKYMDILLDAADKEKSPRLADKIRDILSVSKPKNGEKNILSPTLLVDELHKGGRNKKILWLYSSPNPTVHFKDGGEADDRYMQAIMLCYSGMASFGVSDKASILADLLNEDEMSVFVSEILSKWISNGAEAKKKWVLNFAAIHGGNGITDVFLHYIKEWSENMRGAIAGEAVKALAMNGSSQALMAVDNIAHKFKQRQVKNAAVQALENAAGALGITSDELGDRIVPNLDFDENMKRIFDYGTRKFKVFLTPVLELEIFDENDKKLKNIPAPGKKDDEEIAKKSNAEFRAMKKQLKSIISIQKMRLETAMLADRRWEKTEWEKLFVKNPIMHSFAIGLVWAGYENGKLTQTFRYMEDGTFNTCDEDEYELPENIVVGLAHPIDLDKDTLSAWKEQLEDYEIIQPIEQLNRTVYLINDDEIGKLDLLRFKDRELNGMSLLGRASKYGWQRGSVQDAGSFCTFYREDITKRIKNDDGSVTLEGNGVALNFNGMYVGGEDMDVTIENVRFYKPGTVEYGSYVYDEVDDSKAIMLDKISPRYFSEIINQLEAITKVSNK